MKKIILLLGIVLVTGLNVFSQHLTLSNSTTLFPNGSIMNVKDSGATTLYSHVFVTNNSSTSMSVKCKKKHIAVILGTENYICWGGQCWLDSTLYVVPTPTVINAGATSTSDFSGEYFPDGHPGISTIMYTFYDMNHVNDSVCIFVNYNDMSSGIHEFEPVTISDIYPNPADNSTYLSYNITSKYNNAVIRIIDLLGNKVKDIQLNETDGKIKINTENLYSGVYFYSMILDGKPAFTKKLIVRHN